MQSPMAIFQQSLDVNLIRSVAAKLRRTGERVLSAHVYDQLRRITKPGDYLGYELKTQYVSTRG
jgi:hypothetical protein